MVPIPILILLSSVVIASVVAIVHVVRWCGRSGRVVASVVAVVHVVRWRGRSGRTAVATLSAVVAVAANALPAAVISRPQFPYQHVPSGGISWIQLQSSLEGVAGIVGVLVCGPLSLRLVVSLIQIRSSSIAIGTAALSQSNVGRGEPDVALGPLVVEGDALFGIRYRRFRLG